MRRDLTDLPPDVDVAAEVDRAMWWPAYVPYVEGRGSLRRPGKEAAFDALEPLVASSI